MTGVQTCALPILRTSFKPKADFSFSKKSWGNNAVEKNVFPLGFLLFRLPFFEDRSSRFFGIQARLYPPADLPERPHFSPGTAKRPGNVYNEKRLPGPRSTGQNAPPCRGTPGRRRPCFSDGDPGNRRGRTALSLRRYGSAPQRQKGGGFVLFLMIGIVVVVAVGALLPKTINRS